MASESLKRYYPEIKFGGYTRIDGTVAFYSRVNALLQPNHVLMEIGCGRGAFQEDPSEMRRNLHIFKNRCKKVIGIDVDNAAATNPYLDEFRHLTTDRWPIEDGSIDIAICDCVLEHIEKPEVFFSELARTVKPNGFFCCRTPNAYAYAYMASRLIPNRLHGYVVSKVQGGRQTKDVFPTYYKCNTTGTLNVLLKKAGFDACIHAHESEPAYLKFSPIAMAIGVYLHGIIPGFLKSTLLGYARKME